MEGIGYLFLVLLFIGGWMVWQNVRRASAGAQADENPLPLVAQDLNTLIGFSAWTATNSILEQKKDFDENFGMSFDDALHAATDDFLAGYAIGKALHSAQINGRSLGSSMEALISELQRKLENTFPDLELGQAYRRDSMPTKCGILFGSRDRDSLALVRVWGMMSSFDLAKTSGLVMFAANKLGATTEELNLVQAAGDQMRARYSAA